MNTPQQPASALPEQAQPPSTAIQVQSVPEPTQPPITAPALQCPDLPAESIFNQPVFPYHTKPYTNTPIEIKQVMDYWSRSGDNLRESCGKYGIEYETFRALQHVFPEISAYHDNAQQKKADCYMESALETAIDDSNLTTTVTKTCKNGDTLEYEQGNMVDVRHRELVVHSYMAVAERLSARYRPKTESHNLNVNLSGNLPAQTVDQLFKARDWQGVE
jgi:hypothetical protein